MLAEFKIEDPKNPGRQIFLLAAGLLGATIITLLIFYFIKISQSSSSISLPTEISIEKGSTTRQIADLLDTANIINSPWAFIVYVKTSKASGQIKAGDYMLDPRMSITEIVDVLTAGKVSSKEKKVTIIEGWSNSQLGQYLQSRNVFSKEQFDSALNANYNFKYSEEAVGISEINKNYQGFLFPDTYQLSKNPEASELVQKMLSNFEKRITDQMVADLKSRNLRLYDAVTMASIIEREVGRSGKDLSLDDLTEMRRERREVASVFFNRLRIGMPLQSDATVNYVTGKMDRSVSLADTKIKSSYNTYLNPGLPPTPIGNPGLDSIMAAIYPANTEYLYFLNKIDGEAVFARTLEEHNANKAKYLK